MIKVQNVYHMLSYVYSGLEQKQYREAGAEEFENVAALLAAILHRGAKQQFKQGIYREYQDVKEPLVLVRGKIDVAESLKTRSVMLKRLVCEFDEYTVNNILNQIIKATIKVLLQAEISFAQKLDLNRLMLHLQTVSDVDLRKVNWRMRFNQHNQSYRFLISICQLVAEGLLQTQSDGSTRVLDFLHDKQMSDLFEKFVREYYAKEHPHLDARSTHIDWAGKNIDREYLPVMKTDTVLTSGSKKLVIDTKYYQNPMVRNYGTVKYQSEHLYQMFAYVKNLQTQQGDDSEVSGVLLYAVPNAASGVEPGRGSVPSRFYDFDGNIVGATAVNLDQDFSHIRQELDAIPTQFFESKLFEAY